MKRTLLLIKTTLLLTIFGASNSFAQYVDVTSQYIPNAGFEECETATMTDGVVQLLTADKNPMDYESAGWKYCGPFDNSTAYNAGVATYPIKVKYSKWLNGVECPTTGPTAETNLKAMCFTGSKSAIYQTAEVTLPAGSYRLNVNVWPYDGQYSHEAPTSKVLDQTGFIANDGNSYMQKDLNTNKQTTLNSNEWNLDIIEFELSKPVVGRFQICYGNNYAVVIDNIKLEYLGGVITTALANVVTKAKALNTLLGSNADLTTAIGAAEDFIANPTTQDNVAIEVEKLYNAMSTALATATQPLDITSVYIDNPSFETGNFGEWICDDGVVKSINEEAAITPRCDGTKMVTASMATLSQTISHLPAGYYLLVAKLAGSSKLTLGSASTAVKGGTYDNNNPLFLRVYTPAASFEAGNITIGANSSGTFDIDDFHLYYGKDAATLEALALSLVKADASAIIAESQYNNITGEERSETVTALEGSDYAAINTKVNTFVHVKTAYDDFAAAQTKAAPYTVANYPYADKTMLETVKTICGTTAQSSTLAKEMTTQLNTAIAAIPFSNAYCEGVADKVDHTSKIVGADATGSTVTGWTVNNIQICTLTTSKARPVKDQATSDKTVYGTPDSYKSGTSSIQQTINNLPAGKYVLSVSIMASTNLPIAVRINNEKKNTFNGVGTAASSSWKEVVTEFDLTAAGNVAIRLEEGADSGTKLWYCDNFRLYCIDNGGETGIQSVTNGKTTDNSIFDLSGRRVNQPAKGLYIVNGKKVIIK